MSSPQKTLRRQSQIAQNGVPMSAAGAAKENFRTPAGGI